MCKMVEAVNVIIHLKNNYYVDEMYKNIHNIINDLKGGFNRWLESQGQMIFTSSYMSLFLPTINNINNINRTIEIFKGSCSLLLILSLVALVKQGKLLHHRLRIFTFCGLFVCLFIS